MKKNYLRSLNEIIGSRLFLSESFHNKTKIGKTRTEISPEKWPDTWKTIYFKSYPRFDEIILPNPSLSSTTSLKHGLINRQSNRNFSRKPLELSTLSTLIYYSAGVKDKKLQSFSRFYPSAGGRYPLETYLISLNTDIPKGVYHYYLKNHSLEELLTFAKFDFDKYFVPQKWIKKTACFIIIAAVFKRMTIKYGDRGYRHVLAEAGHLAQNFYLVSAALSLSCCAIGGYIEHKLEELLDIDGVDESVVYVLAIGNS